MRRLPEYRKYLFLNYIFLTSPLHLMRLPHTKPTEIAVSAPV